MKDVSVIYCQIQTILLTYNALARGSSDLKTPIIYLVFFKHNIILMKIMCAVCPVYGNATALILKRIALCKKHHLDDKWWCVPTFITLWWLIMVLQWGSGIYRTPYTLLSYNLDNYDTFLQTTLTMLLKKSLRFIISLCLFPANRRSFLPDRWGGTACSSSRKWPFLERVGL